MVGLHNYLEDRYAISSLIIHPMAENEYSKYIYNSFSETIVKNYVENMYNLAFDYGKFLIRKTFEQGNSSHLKNELKALSSNQNDAHCSLGVDVLSVNSDGSIFPCYTLTNKDEFFMGKVNEDNVLEKKKFKNIQLKFVNNTKSGNPICSQCDIVKVCSACPGMMVEKYNRIDAPIELYCNYSVGFIEGFMTAINEILGEDEKYNLLIKMLEEQGENKLHAFC